MGPFLAASALLQGPRGSHVIQLTLIGEHGRAVPAECSAYFRITGGAVWTLPGDRPLVRFTGADWQYQGALWPGMRFEGACRVMFGVPCDPADVSDLHESISIVGCTLFADSVPFARYEPSRDMWRAALTDTWWHAFRIESPGLRELAARPTLRGDLMPPL